MHSHPDVHFLIGSVVLLAAGSIFLVVSFLVRRGHATATRWFGSSVRDQARFGFLATVVGLLTVGRLIVPDAFVDLYTSFFLGSIVLIVGVLIAVNRRDRRTH